MNPHSIKVMIVGAGTGGLCLAQGLRSGGVAVEVFERDRSPSDRLFGYRLGINATGSNALKECLPDALFAKLVESSAKPSQGVTFLDHRLHRLLVIDFPRRDRDAVGSERPVSRAALRQILLEGLDPIVHFGKKFVAFEDAPGSAVTARFEDGSAASGDVLVGADGAGSRVRAQILPQAKRVETGIIIVSGKFGLNDDIRRETPRPILRGPTLILGPKGRFLFANGVEYGESFDNQRLYDPPASDREEYVMWGFSVRREAFASEHLEALEGDKLKGAVLALIDDWHPDLRRLVQRADVATVSAFPVKTSVPIAPWRTRNVTLLGDALHNMTPFRGIGANTALRDAKALRNALVAANRGERELLQVLASYERDMVDYGFRAVSTSLKEMERLHSAGVRRAVTKAMLRTIDRVPLLKGMLHGSD